MSAPIPAAGGRMILAPLVCLGDTIATPICPRGRVVSKEQDEGTGSPVLLGYADLATGHVGYEAYRAGESVNVVISSPVRAA